MDSSSLRPFVEPFDTFEAQASADEESRSIARDVFEAIHVELVGVSALVGHQMAWADLCVRALEPNIFLDPAFAVPLLQYADDPKRPSFLLVWEENGPASFGRLLGLFPIGDRGGVRALDGLVRGFAHNQTSCGTPLVDRRQAGRAIEAGLDWLAAHRPNRNALAFASVAKDGAFHAELRRVCAGSSRQVIGLGEHRRAELRNAESGNGGAVYFASAKRRKERARQVRRLSEAGDRTYASAKTPAEVAVATESFLALEHKGWKGARGTALLADPMLATFTLAMTRLMALQGKCRIDSIQIDGKPVAMGIILSSAGRAYFWKTAFDEAFAPLSPGVQFAMELTRAQLADSSILATDSCAVADHPMIDRLWPDRVTITDLLVELRPDDTRRFARSVGVERFRRFVRQNIKTVWLGMRRFNRR